LRAMKVAFLAFPLAYAAPVPAQSEGSALLQVQTQEIEIVSECGWDLDCPLDYSLEDIKKDALLEGTAMDELALQQAQARAREACGDGTAGINQHGGWCYDSAKATEQPGGDETDMAYKVPANHVSASPVLTEVVADVLRKAGGSLYSVSDFGAGVGQMGHALRAKLPNLDYRGYDGAGNVEEFTNNYVRFADLTVPSHLGPTDYVMSFEVGEHIPQQWERFVIQNLHSHNCKGILMSWAVLEQGGHGHVNCHSNKYIMDIFTKLGYEYNSSVSEKMRKYDGSHNWFSGSAMAFDRIEPNPACSQL